MACFYFRFLSPFLASQTHPGWFITSLNLNTVKHISDASHGCAAFIQYLSWTWFLVIIYTELNVTFTCILPAVYCREIDPHCKWQVASGMLARPGKWFVSPSTVDINCLRRNKSMNQNHKRKPIDLESKQCQFVNFGN